MVGYINRHLGLEVRSNVLHRVSNVLRSGVRAGHSGKRPIIQTGYSWVWNFGKYNFAVSHRRLVAYHSVCFLKNNQQQGKQLAGLHAKFQNTSTNTSNNSMVSTRFILSYFSESRVDLLLWKNREWFIFTFWLCFETCNLIYMELSGAL